MLRIIGIILLVAGVIFGIWFGLWVCFIGGIVEIINVIKSPETDAGIIAFAILKVFGASILGLIAGVIACIPGFLIVIKPTAKEIKYNKKIDEIYQQINDRFKKN
jgi:hypothetical protein